MFPCLWWYIRIKLKHCLQVVCTTAQTESNWWELGKLSWIKPSSSICIMYIVYITQESYKHSPFLYYSECYTIWTRVCPPVWSAGTDRAKSVRAGTRGTLWILRVCSQPRFTGQHTAPYTRRYTIACSSSSKAWNVWVCTLALHTRTGWTRCRWAQPKCAALKHATPAQCGVNYKRKRSILVLLSSSSEWVCARARAERFANIRASNRLSYTLASAASRTLKTYIFVHKTLKVAREIKMYILCDIIILSNTIHEPFGILRCRLSLSL